MALVELETNTLAVLIAGLYCTYNEVNAIAIPESVFLSVAEKLEYFISNNLWDYDAISFEDWIKNCLLIYPKELFADEELAQLQKQTLYWEYPNGNAILFVSMDINVINNVNR